MAQLTDAAFAPIGHDQITFSLFGSPPPKRERAACGVKPSELAAGLPLCSATKQHFITTGISNDTDN